MVDDVFYLATIWRRRRPQTKSRTSQPLTERVSLRFDSPLGGLELGLTLHKSKSSPFLRLLLKSLSPSLHHHPATTTTSSSVCELYLSGANRIGLIA